MAFNTNTDIWIAGAFAAFTVDLLVYPLDTLKTRIQAPDYKRLYKTADGRPTRSLFRGLYQGIGSVILITIPSSGAFFTTYEALKYGINELTPPNSTLFVPQAAVHAVSSGGAELVSCAILTPAEVLKQNAQILKTDAARKRSPTLQVLSDFRKHPMRLWSGYTALAGRNLPFTGLQFPLFEYLKTYFLEKRRREKQAPVDGIFERARITAMSAAIAGTGAAWITTPIDVVKTRMMLAAGQNQNSTEAHNSGQLLNRGLGNRSGQTLYGVAKEVVAADGVQGLFRGAALRSAWTAFGSGLYLSCYESGRFYLEESRKNKDEGHLMERDWSNVKVGVGKSRSQGETVRKSAWQDE